MRVFKNKWFTRWARAENVLDSVLLQVATEVVAGQVEADLGGGLFKKRLAREGRGKRGGYRVLIGYKKPKPSGSSFFMLSIKMPGPLLQIRKRKP